MKIVKLKGGLGNQLFQYSFGRLIEEKYGEKVKYDLHQYKTKFNEINNLKLNAFNVKIQAATSDELKKCYKIRLNNIPHSFIYRLKIILNKILSPSQYYFEKDRKYRDINKIISYNYFDGYWQCEKYFKDIRDILLEELTLRHISSTSLLQIEKIRQENAVFIGIRRPYSFESIQMKKELNKVGTNIEYYKKAVEYIRKRVESPVFYIFSNDIEWVKKNICINEKCVYRTKEMQTSDEEELIIMSECKHAIVSNSTFNWWGAWLIKNENKIVIAPPFWAKNEMDIIPESWISYGELINDKWEGGTTCRQKY